MGSEHYCLRWNNHQANLLGVFSQLLQDERLVDVTLACSEGTPIRAHKVVLSACSSYFQSLFLDHPEKHPIVILKDVRFAELQTLVEFMYKGEVNVQSCQLSALLKTAESLKVKGLAEMTNQNTTLREPEREPDRLRQHTQPNKGNASCDSPIDATLSGPSTSSITNISSSSTLTGTTNLSSSSSITKLSQSLASSSNNNTTNLLKRDVNERCSPSPAKRQMPTIEQNPLMPLDLYQRRRDDQELNVDRSSRDHLTNLSTNNNDIQHHHQQQHQQQQQHQHQQHQQQQQHHQQQQSSVARNYSNIGSGTTSHSINNANEELNESRSPGPTSDKPTSICKEEENMDEFEDDMDIDYDNAAQEVGLNMKIKASSNSGVDLTSTSSARESPATAPMVGLEPESARSTPAIAIASDLTHRPSSRSSRDLTERPSSSGILPSTASVLSPSTLTSGTDSEPIPGPSGLAPVQSVPLSLKKEIDCSDDDNSNSRHMHPRSTSATGGLSADLDYRASHESETSQSPHASGSGVCSGGGSGSTTTLHEQPQTPPSIHPCLYCGAAFSNQSKLTRHILSHSLKTLECRETATHPLLHQAILAHELNMTQLPQQFAYQMNAAMAASGADPQESAAAVAAAAAAAMEMDFVSAVRAAGACNIPGLSTGCTTTSRGLVELDASGTCGTSGLNTTGGGGSGGGNRGGSSTSGNGGLLLSGASSSPSTSTSLPGSSNNDPNSVVLCKFCGKSFPDVSSLITHLTIHTGDRPFKCEYCGKAFKLRHHMKDHCRVHTGERPFRCQMCGKTFSRSTILKAHEKTHFPKYVRKFFSPSPVETKDELPQ